MFHFRSYCPALLDLLKMNSTCDGSRSEQAELPSYICRKTEHHDPFQSSQTQMLPN